MERRLSAALAAGREAFVVAKEPVAKSETPLAAISAPASGSGVEAPPPLVQGAVPMERAATVASGEDEAPWPIDEAGEAAFLATAREGGEVIVPVAPVVPAVREAATDDESKTALPALDVLVQRIPAEVRETLEDLFRAKFTTVRRVPAKALDSAK